MNKKANPTVAEIWENSAIASSHPYLDKKEIDGHHARMSSTGDLLLPLKDKNGIIKDLQYIDTKGNKSFGSDGDLCGWHLMLGKPNNDAIVICDGYATGATIYECTNLCTVISFRLDNLELVSKIIKAEYPNSQIVIAGDDDNETKGSPRKSHAYSIAESIKAKFITPDFGSHRPDHVKDFNDLAKADCRIAVGAAFSAINEIPVAGPQGFSMDAFALNGQSSAMKQQIMDDKYVLKPLALVGQSTVFYAAPNAGKTLLTLKLLIDAIESHEIDAKNVYYINADDNFKGLTTKLEIAEKYGFKMLAPHHKGFERDQFSNYLQTLIAEEKCRGMIIIIDTLKKFLDLMQKSSAREMGIVMREFVTMGGTIVALAHVNKNKDANGKSVYQGTSDVPEDVDCTYTIEVNDSAKTVKRVTFVNGKARGYVANEVTFEYSNEKLQYLDLIRSVKTLSEAEAIAIRQIEQRDSLLHANKEIIESILFHITEGITNKTILVKAVAKATINSEPKVKAVLDKHTGDNYESGDRWSYDVGAKNTHTYFKLDAAKTYKNIK